MWYLIIRIILYVFSSVIALYAFRAWYDRQQNHRKQEKNVFFRIVPLLPITLIYSSIVLTIGYYLESGSFVLYESRDMIYLWLFGVLLASVLFSIATVLDTKKDRGQKE